MTGQVLVTGGSGALGRRVLAGLRSAGHDAISASRTQGALLDITDASAVDDLVDRLRPAAIVHLAAALPGSAEAALRLVNVEGTRAVAAAAARTGALLVAASSAAVYGTHHDAPSREDDVLAPTTAYGQSKLAAEQAIESFGRGIRAVSLRIFNLTGAGFPQSLPMRLREATASDPVILRGLDDFVRDYVHPDDVADAIVASVEAGVAPGHLPVNVGSGVPVSTRELVEALARFAPVYARDEGGSPDRVWADPTRCREILGRVPRGFDPLWVDEAREVGSGVRR